jgi:D-alanine-D-alanine ligase-like ATP-grasp enzyme/ribosomal protein S18 acetylase RimI-like enzyme
VEESLVDDRPDLVFNLVESLAGSDRLSHLAAVLLDDFDLPYTGSRAEAVHLTNNKPRAKERLRAAGLPTPDWTTADRGDILPPPYIIKAAWEHASLGIDDHAVITQGDGSTVTDQIASRARQLGQSCFAEKYIDGREFNLSLIAASDGPRVLPPAEIDFSSFPRGKPKIVGYAAKWEPQAPEFSGTPRRFDFAASDAPLLDWLRSLAVDCWRLFDLAGYARVDFRVDSRGQPWILEINANPCLSPDAGFAAALDRAGLPLDQAVQSIVDDALRPDRVQSSGFSAGDSKPGTGDRGQGAEVREAKSAGEYSVLSTQYSVGSAETPATSKRRRRPPAIKLRTTVTKSDCKVVRQIVEATGLFRPGEIEVAVELVQTRLDKGPESGYEFIFADQKGETAGYICFGRNSLTVGSFDVYWIAVEPSKQGLGIGRLLLDEAQRQIAATGGARIYIETSHRSDYEATRGFYERCGYKLEAVLEDFYAPGDSKAIYVKVISAPVHISA